MYERIYVKHLTFALMYVWACAAEGQGPTQKSWTHFATLSKWKQ